MHNNGVTWQKISLPMVVSIVTGICYLLSNHFFRFYLQSDGPFHLAAIRNFPFDGNMVSPILQLKGVSDHHYNISVALQALFYRYSGSMHLTVIISGALFIIFFLFSFSLLTTRYCRNKNEVFMAVIALLFLSGPAGIIWAGAYSISAIMINGFYPQTFAYGIFFLCLYSATYKKAAAMRWLTIILLSACLIQHLLTGVVLLFSYYLLQIQRYFESNEVDWYALVLPLPSIIMYIAWPYFPVLELFNELWPAFRSYLPWFLGALGGTIIFKHFSPILIVSISELWLRFNRNFVKSIQVFLFCTLVVIVAIVLIDSWQNESFFYVEHFKQKNPLISIIQLAALPAVLFLLVKRERDFITLWVFALIALALLGWAIDVSGYWRLIFFSLIAAMVAVGRQLVAVGKVQRYAVEIVAVVMLMTQGIFFTLVASADTYDELQWVAEKIPEDAIVLADARSSYRLAGVAGKRVVTSFASHWSNYIKETDREIRRVDVNTFFRETTSNAMRRNLLQRYQPAYLLVAVTSYNIEGYCYQYSELLGRELGLLAKAVIYRGNEYTLLKL